MAVKKSGTVDMSVPASPPVFNPSRTDEVEFAEYRANAIARDVEQRREDGREQHQQHDQIIGEAMAYAWMLQAAGRWTRNQVIELEKRLWGDE